MTIRRYLAILLCVAVSGLLLLGTAALLQFHRNESAIRNLTNVTIPGFLAASDLGSQLKSLQISAINLVNAPDETIASQLKDKIGADMARLAQELAAQSKIADSSTQEKIIKQAQESLQGYFDALDQVAKTRMGGQKEIADAILSGTAEPYQLELQQILETLRVEKRRSEDKSTASIEASLQQSLMILSVLLVVLLTLLIFLGLRVYRRISHPLSEALKVAQRVAERDLTTVIEVKSKDEIGMLLQALKDMNESLREIVSEVRARTDSISTGSQQIANGNADLSQRTEEQASSLEEAAAAIHELTSTVKQNSENARHANQLAVQASEVAVKGGAVVGHVVTTMSAINESSREIIDIISLIDGIAFQTNLLALNAAVEAARAGEQGRGFAVVAAEVRNLAQRSAMASKQIKALIDNSIIKVAEGSKLVDQAGKTMEDVVSSVKLVTDIMAEITMASQEQSSGIAEVNQSVAQMDQATQQNAAMVEETAAASASMQEEAQILARLMEVFKLTETVDSIAPISESSTELFRNEHAIPRPVKLVSMPSESRETAEVVLFNRAAKGACGAR